MRKWIITGAVLAGCTSLACAQQGDAPTGAAIQSEVSVTSDLSVFAGLRLWANQWDVPIVTREAFLADPTNPQSLMLRDLTANHTSSYRIAPMPFVAVRYGDVLASISYLPKTKYDMDGALSEDVERDELDVNVGYYVHPRVVLSLGYKQGSQSKLTDLVPESEVKVRGFLLGASFNAPLSGPFSLYGNLAYGMTRSSSDDFKQPTGGDIDGTYKVAELGVSYSLSHLIGSGAIKGAALTLGYRSWVLTLDNVDVGVYSPSNPAVPVAITSRDSRSTTDGLVLGAVAVF